MLDVRFLDRMLRDGGSLGEELSDPRKAGAFLKQALPWVFVLGGYYGLVMGAYSAFNGASGWYAVADMFKVPVLLIGTTALCFPALYVFGIAGGAALAARSLAAVLSASLVMLVLLLTALSPVVLFFLSTFDTYAPVKLMQVVVWTVAGLGALRFLRRTLRVIDPALTRNTGLMLSWMLLFGLVGLQGAWMTRPFIGAPGQSFQLFRHPGGNVFENLVRTVAGKPHDAARKVPLEAPAGSESDQGAAD